jgi:hypothetical protein
MSANTTPETHKILCSGCHARLTVRKSDAGKKINCPKCRKAIDWAGAAKTPSSRPEKPATKAVKSDINIAAGVQAAPATASKNASSDSDDWGAPTRKLDPAPNRNAHSSTDDRDESVSGLVKWGGGGVVAVLLIVGCYYLFTALFSGPAVGNLNGKVYLGNVLLNSGTVTFYGRSTRITCTVQSDGTYQANGIERGELIITVVQLNPKFKDGATRRKEAKGKIENLIDDDEKQHLLPEIYADTMTSPLRFTLQKNSDIYDIHLEKDLE